MLVVDDLFAGELATELLKELTKVCKKACFCKSNAEKLRNSIQQLLPIMQEIKYSGVELPQHRQRQLNELTTNLMLGLELARKASASSRWNVYKTLQLARKMEKVEERVSKFVNGGPMMGHVLADMQLLRVESCQGFERVERRLEERLGAVTVGGSGVVEEAMRRFEEEREGNGRGILGMKVGKEKVKEMLMRGGSLGMEVVGICGIGGCGKTSLAREVCRDLQIQNHFNGRIFFETVSQSPNVEQLKLKIWEQIMGHIGNGHYAIPPWTLQFDWKARGPTLIVLDDVWSLTDLEQLIFRIPGCKTLVVSRFRFPTVISCTYELEMLGEEEALSLFCYSAFEQPSIPTTANKKLVNQVVAECKGLPLALKVVGSSLRGQPEKIWVSAKNKLSQGETISESHEAKLLERLAISIKFLSKKVRECFLDLGSFPEDKKIPLDVLINMWVEIHDLNEEDAFAILIELHNKNLITVSKHDRAGEVYSSYSEHFVTQHDMLRDLALHMSSRESLNNRKRLIMPRREARLPKDWVRNKDQPFDAQIVSIHTDEMKEADWFEMYFPKAEVLILNFASDTYFLPPFIGIMPKLKVLIIVNFGTSSAFLQNLLVFSTLGSLKSLWLAKITVPPLPKTTLPLLNLQKISLTLCEVNKSFNGSKVDFLQIFPRLSDLNIDHCIDLTELPSSIGRARSLESLSITNCHDLCEVPDELGNLKSLLILRIYACPLLKSLPRSICGLKRLKYLDISQCINMRTLPEAMGQLISLEKIDMRECSQIRKLPRSATALRSLGHVVCDEEISCLWKEAGKVLPELRIQVVEERFTLDWLTD